MYKSIQQFCGSGIHPGAAAPLTSEDPTAIII